MRSSINSRPNTVDSLSERPSTTGSRLIDIPLKVSATLLKPTKDCSIRVTDECRMRVKQDSINIVAKTKIQNEISLKKSKDEMTDYLYRKSQATQKLLDKQIVQYQGTPLSLNLVELEDKRVAEVMEARNIKKLREKQLATMRSMIGTPAISICPKSRIKTITDNEGRIALEYRYLQNDEKELRKEKKIMDDMVSSELDRITNNFPIVKDMLYKKKRQDAKDRRKLEDEAYQKKLQILNDNRELI